MKMKKVLAQILLLCMVLGLASMAMASQNVIFYSNKPQSPITTCSQAGNIYLSFDNHTKMHEGDTITFPPLYSTVCNAIDYFLVLEDTFSVAVLPAASANPIGNTATDPVITTTGAGWIEATIDGVLGADNTAMVGADGTTYELGFRVKAAAGASQVTMTLGRRSVNGATPGKFTANPLNNTWFEYKTTNDADLLTVKLFDGNNKVPNATGNASGFYEPLATVTTYVAYTDPINAVGVDESDNVLCLDVTLYANDAHGPYVYATPANVPLNSTYRLAFDGQYSIMQFSSMVTTVIEKACKDACGEIPLVSGVDQTGANVAASGLFTFGTYNTGGAAACPSTVDRFDGSNYANNTLGNAIKITTTLAANEQYRVMFTVKTKTGGTGTAAALATKARFSTVGVSGYWIGAANSNFCSCTASGAGLATAMAGADVSSAWAFGTLGADYTTITGVVTVPSTATYTSMVFALPQIQAILTGTTPVAVGDEIIVDVNFSKLPCYGASTTPICVAKTIATVASATSTTTVTFPYATAAASTEFWSGLGIANKTSASLTITITAYSENGGTATATEVLAPNAIFAKTLTQIAGMSTFTMGTTPLDPTKNCYITVSAPGTASIDGIMFVGDLATTYLHGYLGR